MTAGDPLPTARPRNPVTHQAHRQEVLRQITLPLVIGGLIILAAALGVLLTGIRGPGEIHRWADVSLIWLIIPMMIAALLFLVLTAGLAYAITRLLGVLPPFARQVQDVFVIIKFRVEKICDSLAEPILRSQQRLASLQTLRRRRGRRPQKSSPLR